MVRNEEGIKWQTYRIPEIEVYGNETPNRNVNVNIKRNTAIRYLVFGIRYAVFV